MRLRILLVLAVVALTPGARIANTYPEDYARTGVVLGQVDGQRSGVPLFAFKGAAPVPDSLSRDITVNGTAVRASVWCQGPGATSSSWACDGQTLTAAGSGGSFAQGSPLGAGTAVNGAGTRYYTGGAFSPGASDVVIEAIIRQTVTDTVTPFSTWVPGTNQGFELRSRTASAAIEVVIGGATTTALITSTTNLDDHYYHVLAVIDRSGSGQLYVNGKASGAAVAVSGVGTITGGPLTLLGRVDGTRLFNDSVVHLAAWSHPDVGSHTQDQLARDRAAVAFGLSPGFSVNTVRGSPAVVEIGGGLHRVGSHWMRSEPSGYLNEAGVTNLALQSENLGATWTKSDVGDVIGGSVASPFGTATTTSGIIGDSTDGNHGVSQAITVTAATYAFSAYFQAGTQTWARLLNATTGSSLYCDLSGAGSLGATASTVSTWIERLGTTNWYRCGFAFTGTAAAHTFHVRVAQANGDDSVAGNGSAVQIYAWGVQVEAQPVLSSYVATVGSTAARAADTLRYTVTEFDIDSRGISLVADIDRGVVVGGISDMLRVSDGASNNDRVNILLTSAGTAARIIVTAVAVGQTDLTGTTNTGTGGLLTIAAFANTNDVRLFVNGTVEGTPDTNATMPANLDTVDIGADFSARIPRARVYRGEVRR